MARLIFSGEGMGFPTDGPALDSFGRLRVSEPTTIFDGKLSLDDLPLFYDEVADGLATSNYVQQTASVRITTTTTNGDRLTRQTKRYFNYQPGKSQLVFVTFVGRSGGAVDANCTRRVGAYDDDDGILFSLVGNSPFVVRRTSTSGAAVDNSVPQSGWNLDTMDGTGPSGVSLDFAKTQILVIDYEWLGVGRVRIGWNLDGQTIYCHEFLNANNLDVVYMQTGSQPIRYEIENTGIVADAQSMDCICASVQSEGGFNPSSVTRSIDRGIVTRNGIGTTLEPLVTVRLKEDFEKASVFFRNVTLITTGNEVARWVLLLNPTFAVDPDYTIAATVARLTTSAVEADVSSAATLDATPGGTELASGYFSNDVNQLNEALETALTLASTYKGSTRTGTRDQVCLALQTLTGTGNFAGGIGWEELF